VGPYVSERQWGTVREDYSANGEAWDYLPHDHASSRAYQWGEDGVAGFCDVEQRLIAKAFDESEFLSPHGLRALSAYHREHPYTLEYSGLTASIDYEPAESTAPMFRGTPTGAARSGSR
jgi:hypothetical protein